jgi:pimeloyl-ACP methyl ester carboxylesterase
MTDIVLVPGSYHAGWYFETAVPLLEAEGHRVIAVTLAGLDRPGADLGGVNLDTHIDDVVAAIHAARARDIVLVGHSYGGMVITGVAARKSVSIGRMIYLDAMVPQSGQRLWDLISEETRQAFLGGSDDGISTKPPADLTQLDPRVLPHPLATYFQPIEFDPADLPEHKTYVWAQGYVGSPFGAIYERVRQTPGWETLTVPYGHDVFREAPAAMAQLIAERATVTS